MQKLLITLTIILYAAFAYADNIPKSKEEFRSFTGKITGNKVRMRTASDLDSHVVRQLNKNELVYILEESNDFWGIKPPPGIKAYVYRNYIIDNVVEADKVNIRLQPNLDAPVIGQLKLKDQIYGEILESNNKWMEISIPENVCFYIAKEYITYAGNEHFYARMLQRKEEVDKLLNSAYFITQAEMKKPYDEMTPQEAIDQFDAIIKGYSDFTEHVKQAKEGLALIQDNYLQKKIAYLEAKASMSEIEKDELITAIDKANTCPVNTNTNTKKIVRSSNKNLTDKMHFWEPIEESLYLTWTTFHPEKSLNDFYKEQEINSTTITGVIESYSQSIKNKPGDYIVKTDKTKAYLYSTKINLDEFVGKTITLKVSPRPNNNFAFPAYYVNEIE